MQTKQTTAARPSRSSVENSQNSFRTASWQCPPSLLSLILPGTPVEGFCHHVVVYAWPFPGWSLQAWVSEVSEPPVVECPAPQVPRPWREFNIRHRQSLAMLRLFHSLTNMIPFIVMMPKTVRSSATLKPARLSPRPSSRRLARTVATRS